jgi:hypothetical protein
MKRFLSLGAGVQSSTLALMIAGGEFPMIDAAIFADVGAEPQTVYDWLNWLEQQLPFPVYRVNGGNLRERIMRRVRREKSGSGGPPFYTTPNGMLPRQCTRDHKLVPIEREQRRLLGLSGKRGPKEIVAEAWLGISFDEAMRMKPARLRFVRNVYPLVDRGLTRGHCLEWMARKGYPTPPRSACTFCPYRSDQEWKGLKQRDPEAFADAVAMDKAIRGGFVDSTEQLFVHRSRVPLDQVDFRDASDFGQRDFINECEGMCGV